MAAQTPCPSWCEADHNRVRNHSRHMGEYMPVTVEVFAWAHLPDVAPVVSVTNHRRPSGAAPEDLQTHIELCEARGFAALMDTFGKPEIAGMVRDAIEEIEDAQGGGV